MDIDILLALQDFRNGTGAFLAAFLSKMTFLGEMNTVFVIMAIMVALYAGFKPYPMDYDEAGNLIVDGAKMANDTFKGIGWCMAFYIGWILQRRFVSFSTEIPMSQRISRTANGLLGFYAMSLIIVPVVKDLIGGPLGTLVSCFIQMFFIVFIYPLCIARYEKRKK